MKLTNDFLLLSEFCERTIDIICVNFVFFDSPRLLSSLSHVFLYCTNCSRIKPINLVDILSVMIRLFTFTTLYILDETTGPDGMDFIQKNLHASTIYLSWRKSRRQIWSQSWLPFLISYQMTRFEKSWEVWCCLYHSVGMCYFKQKAD